jgi:hypothetical protein
MPIAVGFDSVPSHIGPGYEISVTASGFTVNNGDTIVARVQDGTGSYDLVVGACTLFAGFGTGFIQFGRPVPGTGLVATSGLGKYVSPASSIQIYLEWRRSNLTLVDSATSAGWSWDPTGGVYELVSNLLNEIFAPSSGGLLDILNSVRKTY